MAVSLHSRAIVFDLDGTLIDSRKDIAQSCNYVLQQAGRPPLAEETIAGFVGDGARALLERAFGVTTPEEEIDQYLAVFLDYYTSNPVVHTTFMPGAKELLEALDGRPLGLCTNKPRASTDAVLAGLDLTRTFGSVVAGDDTEEKKPHPAPLFKIAKDLGMDPERMIMVGDGPQDIGAGKAVGCITVGIRGGLLPLERLMESNPDHLLDTLSDFLPWLDELETEPVGS